MTRALTKSYGTGVTQEIQIAARAEVTRFTATR